MVERTFWSPLAMMGGLDRCSGGAWWCWLGRVGNVIIWEGSRLFDVNLKITEAVEIILEKTH